MEFTTQNLKTIVCPNCSYKMVEPFKSHCPNCDMDVSELIKETKAKKMLKKRAEKLGEVGIKIKDNLKDNVERLKGNIGKFKEKATSFVSKTLQKDQNSDAK